MPKRGRLFASAWCNREHLLSEIVMGSGGLNSGKSRHRPQKSIEKIALCFCSSVTSRYRVKAANFPVHRRSCLSGDARPSLPLTLTQSPASGNPPSQERRRCANRAVSPFAPTSQKRPLSVVNTRDVQFV